MKTLTFVIALTLYGTNAMAFSFDLGSVTPTLKFPEDTSGSETVTMEKMSVGN